MEQTRTVSTCTAAMTLAKVCIGPGLLALPFATNFGGLMLSPILLLAVGLWNGYSCLQMIQCRNATMNHTYPSHIASAYGKIAFSGLGQIGVFLVDFSIFVTLVGVCVSLHVNFGTLLNALPYSMPSTYVLIWMSMIVLYPLSCIKDLRLLSQLSPAGLLCILLCVVAIFWFGIKIYGAELLHDVEDGHLPTDAHLWPKTLADGTQFFGVVTFCYGVCAIAFPVEESMIHPEKFSQAIMQCVIYVCIFYLIVGAGISLLFSYGDDGISDNILLNLPNDSIFATVARIMMALVCVVTYPLAFVLPAQLVENLVVQRLMRAGVASTDHAERHTEGHVMGEGTKLPVKSIWVTEKFEYSRIAEDTEETKHEIDPSPCERNLESPLRTGSTASNEDFNVAALAEDGACSTDRQLEASLLLRCIIRFILIATTTLCAASVPCFGLIIELLGSFTIALQSFIMPALLNLLLYSYPRLCRERNFHAGDALSALNKNSGAINRYDALSDGTSSSYPLHQYSSEANSESRCVSRLTSCKLEVCLDVVLTALGIVACIIGTTLATMKIVHVIIDG